MRIRAGLLTLAILMAPQFAQAEYLDVITTRLGECTLEKYLSIVQEFRGVMEKQKYRYRVEIAVPLMNEDTGVVYWLGRAPTLASFGEEFARYERERMKSGTPEANVDAKFQACGQQESRSGHMLR